MNKQILKLALPNIITNITVPLLGMVDIAPEKALKEMDSMMSGMEEPTADMYYTRGILYTGLGEEGKAHNDWKKALELIQDTRFIDAYIIPICKRTMELICMKERDFISFDPIEYLDSISVEFSQKTGTPCRGIFYITTYRNFRMKYQSGGLSENEDIYHSTVMKLLKRILAYGRDFRTVVNIIEEVLEDFHYNPDSFVEDDNLRLHLCDLIRQKYIALSENFSDEHIARIFRHWNDGNMFDLEYWVDELMKSVSDDTILQKLRSFGSDREDYNIDSAAEDYVRKFLLLSADGQDLSEEP